MSLTALAFILSAALYTGFQWTIRVLVYPQFRSVSADDFVGYERVHQRRVSITVGPLFLALGLSAIALLIDPPAGGGRVLPAIAVALVAMVLGATAFGAVPLHRRLSDGFDPDAHRRLLVVDTVRLGASVLATAVGAVLALH